MIDKSIRQHYQTGEKVKKFGYDVGQKLISSAFPTKDGKLDVGQLAKNVATNKLTTAATKKLAGTGILSSLGPIGMLIAYMLAKKGMKYAKGKMPDIKTSLQAFQTGFGSPEEQRELRQLEKRRDYMLHRRDVLNKKISEKNLKEVTNRINEIKKTAPVTVTDYEGEAYGTPDTIKDILDKQYEFEDKKTQQFRDPVITPFFPGEDERATDTIFVRQDPDTGDASIAERIAAEKREAEKRAVQEAVNIQIGTSRGNGGNQESTSASSGSGYSRGDYGGRGYHWAKGGRVDKALGGRSRDIG